MNKNTNEIIKELEKNADKNLIEKSKHFFKEAVQTRGYSAQTTTRMAKQYLKTKLKGISKDDVFDICTGLWQSGYMEETFIACIFSNAFNKEYEPKDFKIFESWLKKYVNNWASCDTLCNHTIGDFVMMYPKYAGELKKWATSKNRWVKRGAAVTLIIPARSGLFLKEVFEIADILLTDTDDMVQKGYGWMLKAASEAGGKCQASPNMKAVFDYVVKNKARMPRTALRYAIEKMPQHLRKEAIEK